MTETTANDSKENFAVLDLFSGIGGFSLGLEAAGAFRTVAFCERDKFCQAVLRKHWPNVPIYDDVNSFDWQGDCDIITGGYPCQPFSVAGKQKGAADDRHLWPAMLEIIKRKRPRYVVAENVAGHIAMGLDQVLFDLESASYTARPLVIPACGVDAPHRRERVFVLAHAEFIGLPRQGQPVNAVNPAAEASRQAVEPVDGGEQGIGSPQPRMGGMANGFSRWMDEPDIGRVAAGVKNRAERLKALGNAVVPQVVTQIGRAILAAEH